MSVTSSLFSPCWLLKSPNPHYFAFQNHLQPPNLEDFQSNSPFFIRMTFASLTIFWDEFTKGPLHNQQSGPASLIKIWWNMPPNLITILWYLWVDLNINQNLKYTEIPHLQIGWINLDDPSHPPANLSKYSLSMLIKQYHRFGPI